VRESQSFAPLGLGYLALFTHGLRRGLHSCAALRLKVAAWRIGVGRQEAEQTLGLRRCRAEGSLRDTRSIPQRAQREPIFRPVGAWIAGASYPRLAPWAAFLRRSAAESGSLENWVRRRCGPSWSWPAEEGSLETRNESGLRGNLEHRPATVETASSCAAFLCGAVEIAVFIKDQIGGRLCSVRAACEAI